MKQNLQMRVVSRIAGGVLALGGLTGCVSTGMDFVAQDHFNKMQYNQYMGTAAYDAGNKSASDTYRSEARREAGMAIAASMFAEDARRGEQARATADEIERRQRTSEDISQQVYEKHKRGIRLTPAEQKLFDFEEAMKKKYSKQTEPEVSAKEFLQSQRDKARNFKDFLTKDDEIQEFSIDSELPLGDGYYTRLCNDSAGEYYIKKRGVLASKIDEKDEFIADREGKEISLGNTGKYRQEIRKVKIYKNQVYGIYGVKGEQVDFKFVEIKDGKLMVNYNGEIIWLPSTPVAIFSLLSLDKKAWEENKDEILNLMDLRNSLKVRGCLEAMKQVYE